MAGSYFLTYLLEDVTSNALVECQTILSNKIDNFFYGD